MVEKKIIIIGCFCFLLVNNLISQNLNQQSGNIKLLYEKYDNILTKMEKFYVNEIDYNLDILYDAEKEFKIILEKNPNDIISLLNLNYMYLVHQDSIYVNKLKENFNKLLALQPNDPLIQTFNFVFQERIIHLKEMTVLDENYKTENMQLLAKKLLDEFPKEFIIRIHVFPYICFKSRDEFKNFIIETLTLRKNKRINSPFFKYFIESRQHEKAFFRSITMLNDDALRSFFAYLFENKKLKKNLIEEFFNLDAPEIIFLRGKNLQNYSIKMSDIPEEYRFLFKW